MPPVTINPRKVDVDDTGDNLSGTIHDNAWLQDLQDRIDVAFGKVPALDGTGKVPDAALSSNVALKNIDNSFVAQTLASGSVVGGANGLLNFNDTAAPVDKKRWRVVNYQDGNFHLEALNDANAVVLGRTSFMRNGGINLATTGWLQFPAVNIPSADPNTLDDYEEGAWTPNLLFGGAQVGMTFTERTGYYVKIGLFVWVGYRFIVSAKGTSAGNATIGGLPFPEKPDGSQGATNYGGALTYMTALHTSLVTMPILYASGTTLTFLYPSAGSVANLTDVHFLTGATVIGFAMYRAV